MDVTPLLQSGNWWLIIAGIGITLAAQWAKNKISPSNPTPTPAPAPDPNAPAPAKPTLMQTLLAFLEQWALAKAKGAIPTSSAESVASKATADEAAALHLISSIGLKVDPSIVPK